MNSILRTDQFNLWLKELRDPIGKARIIARIRSAESGNFGDCEPIGNGISEMRVHSGPGYRIYFIKKGDLIFVLLCGGNKSSQTKDISLAKKIAKELDNR